MGDGVKVRRTRHPSIYTVTRPGQKRIRYRVSYRIPGVGQRSKTLKSLEEAKAFQASVRDPVKASQIRLLARERMTLGEFFPLFLERRRNLAPSTRARYEGSAKLHILPGRLSHQLLASITRDDVENWITDLERAGVGKGAIDKAYRVLRAALGAAMLEGKILSNPARSIDAPRAAPRDPFFLTADQVDAIATEVPSRHKVLVYFLAYTGLRIGEASALRVQDLNLPQQRLTVRANSPEVAGRKITGQTKTKKPRRIDLPASLCIELSQHLELFGRRHADGTIADDSYVFTHAQGGQIRQNNWRTRVLQPAARRAGVVRLSVSGRTEAPRVHDLRHTAASLAAAYGYSLHEVKEMLGHTTIKTTSDLYLHLFSDLSRSKADGFGKVLTASQAKRGNVLPFAATSA
jgi:integrase